MNKKLIAVAIFIALLLLAGYFGKAIILAPEVTGAKPLEGRYEFVPGPTPIPVISVDQITTVNPLNEGDWVVVYGSTATISSPAGSKDLGVGDKCFVIAIAGPTNTTYKIQGGGHDLVAVGDSSFEKRWSKSLEGARALQIKSWMSAGGCKGIDVWTIADGQ